MGTFLHVPEKRRENEKWTLPGTEVPKQSFWDSFPVRQRSPESYYSISHNFLTLSQTFLSRGRSTLQCQLNARL